VKTCDSRETQANCQSVVKDAVRVEIFARVSMKMLLCRAVLMCLIFRKRL